MLRRTGLLSDDATHPLPSAMLLLALSTLVHSPALSQETSNKRPALPANFDASQFLRTADDVERLRVLCRGLTVTATDTLNARADNPTSDNEVDALNAIKALRILRASDPNSLRALCRNITLNTNRSEMIPLEGYIAAQALAEIGGEGVAEALFASMRPTVDREGLLLRAFILRKMDSPEIALHRVQLAIKSAEARSPNHDVLRDAYLKSLRQLEALLSNPKLGEYKNWPGNHRPPVPGGPLRVSN